MAFKHTIIISNICYVYKTHINEKTNLIKLFRRLGIVAKVNDAKVADPQVNIQMLFLKQALR